METSVQYLKGVGPKVAKLFKKLGVETVYDLIFFFPRDYDDRSLITPIAALQPVIMSVIIAEIIALDLQLTRSRFSVLKVKLADKSGQIQAVWFNQPYLAQLFRCGMRLVVTGKLEISTFDASRQFQARDYEIYAPDLPKIIPVYALTEGLFPKKLRGIIKNVLDDLLDLVQDWLPKAIKKKYALAELQPSIMRLHFPDKLDEVAPARRRLVFDEFFSFQLGLGLRREKVKAQPGITFQVDQVILDRFLSSLSFKLTAAQARVWQEILAEMVSARPMNRLLQGDVGSGKTIIAVLAALVAIKSGYQAAVMAPTEILAQQHFEKMTKLLKSFKVKVGLLTSTTSKQGTNHSVDKYDLVVGTHALIQEGVGYKKLGLVVIDEQHRFGVVQRAALVQKGVTPDVLVMTATPIPRSLSLTLYGDLDRSIIDELPPGRTPVKTYFVPESKRAGAYNFIRQEIMAGRQVFVVCPLVAESEKIDLRAAIAESERLQKEIFPEYKVGLLHGRLKNKEKEKIMADFKVGKINVLVSTTVIEVGIDIPNATVMIIEHAERFGLSQLHQLRGRIGRGGEQAHCFLLADAKSPEAKARLKALIDSTDGFYLAEVDLQLRGPGDFCGTRQSGLPSFRVADIIRDEKILCEAREAAFGLIAEDRESARNIWQNQGEKAQGANSGAPLN